MSHAETCPVCKGTGKLHIPYSPNSTAAMFSGWQLCHGCNGLGWVTVGEINEPSSNA
jgi:DnaJ-class molecular chaperone